ncbi:MAG: hypothetical protein PHE89_02445 [Alphaproteobacteria bacterium]|nr:hypothetical protein [Alphaproteobacteria bacterium]
MVSVITRKALDDKRAQGFKLGRDFGFRNKRYCWNGKEEEIKNKLLSGMSRLAFLKRNFIPNILKQQLGRCNRSDATNKPLMFAEFTKELVDLNNKGLISWRGHKLTRYWIYKKLIKGGKQ